MQGFATMERVLDGVHKIAVADMVAEASVRKHMRDLYMKYAVLSTGICVAPITTIAHCDMSHTSSDRHIIPGQNGFVMLLSVGSRHLFY